MDRETLTKIENLTAYFLSDKEDVTPEKIKSHLLLFAGMEGATLTESELGTLQKKIESRVLHLRTHGCEIFSEDYHPWLANAKPDIDFYYWNRYKEYLLTKKRPMHNSTVRGIGDITDVIIDHLENPLKTGSWQRRGMVVGHVQSGKTANYIGVMCKAADVGYKVIIVLGGILNSLRNQTQERVDEGFIGKHSSNGKQILGAGLVDSTRTPVFLTNDKKDFSINMANQVGIELANLKEPAVIVIKKNKTSLENLISWLKNNNGAKLKDFPLLLIDDEADQASINTNKPDQEATTINRKIRELLDLFGRSSYLGYTATPFANIFIDPFAGNDLFPRHFILTLESPGNYFGPNRIFLGESGDDHANFDIIRTIDDHEDEDGDGPLPLKHGRDFDLVELPQSLAESIYVFILAKAIRLARGHINTHHSAMINASRFTDMHTRIKGLVDEQMDSIKDAITGYSSFPSDKACRNGIIARFKSLFNREFSDYGFEWEQILQYLKESALPIEVIVINSSKTASQLDYSSRNYPDGRSLVLIGGMSLSRGLTIEGLITSYFLRNSVMYDTLMQMGRWFGYRADYSDLCRIYMTATAESWYCHIADAMNELNAEFRRMRIAKMTPEDFGLCIKAHPEALIVTARNKMRTGRVVPHEISLDGRLAETVYLHHDNKILEHNFREISALVESLGKYESPSKQFPSYMWRNIDYKMIMAFVEKFKSHPLSQKMNPGPLVGFIEKLSAEGKNKWDIYLVSPGRSQKGDPISIGCLEINRQLRKISIDRSEDALAINGDRRRVGYASLEAAGLPLEEIKKSHLAYETEMGKTGKVSYPGSIYRKLREDHNPLLILHIIYGEERDRDGKIITVIDTIPAYGLSFPGEAGNGRPKHLVSYVVNSIWTPEQEGGDDEDEYTDDE